MRPVKISINFAEFGKPTEHYNTFYKIIWSL